MKGAEDISETDIKNVVDFMWKFSEKVRNLRDAEAMRQRIEQLKTVDATKYAADIKQSETELKEMEKKGVASAEEDTKYTAVLSCAPDSATYDALVKGSGAIGQFVQSNTLSKTDFLEIIKGSTMCTVCPSTILTDGMERSRCEIEAISVDKGFGGDDDDCNVPQRGTKEFEEWAILQCMFKHAFQHNQVFILWKICLKFCWNLCTE